MDNPKIRMLLVEDNRTNLIVARTLLTHLGGNVSVAKNGVEALEVLNSENTQVFDMIFLDCQMPEMDGYEVTKRIRVGEAGPHNCNIPIIAMTANAMKGDKEKCLDIGMDDYLSKPIDHDLLTGKITKWANTAKSN